jgi:hypothetical protein
MEVCQAARLLVNKAIVFAEPNRRGNPGYGRLRTLKVLVGFGNDTRIVEHLKSIDRIIEG